MPNKNRCNIIEGACKKKVVGNWEMLKLGETGAYYKTFCFKRKLISGSLIKDIQY